MCGIFSGEMFTQFDFKNVDVFFILAVFILVNNFFKNIVFLFLCQLRLQLCFQFI